MDFNKIKLIIWDLDNTFWSGTISETDVKVIDQNTELIKLFTDAGVINSICSKNTFEIATDKLKELDILDYFVFPSIDWTPKGQRIKNQIKTMVLRAENVLFIDDEITNLEEAKHYSPELMVGKPDIIKDLYSYALNLEKKDVAHTRLNQYKLLEQKNIEQKKFDNNEDFLFASNIKVDIHTNCKPEAERIHDLLLRSNQLNYTKKRISYDELLLLLDNKNVQCGYVSVNDKFGDYGIVGFYALIDNKLEHFLFSCRTIGLGIEQYVYSGLNCPVLEVTGEVVSSVEKKAAPIWINKGTVENKIINTESTDNDHLILVKGPCDLSKSMTYIRNSDEFVYEFTYVNEQKGNSIAAHNHSAHIKGLLDYTEDDKDKIAEECIFIDRAMLDGSMFTQKYDIIFLSTLIESNFGIYRKKGTDLYLAFGSFMSPLTDKNNWEDYINGVLFNSGNVFTKEYLETFSDAYEFIGKTSPEDYIQFLERILDRLDSKTVLCLILGVEFPYEKNMKYDFKERHISHKELNNKIRIFAGTTDRIKLIDLNDIVKSHSDFAGDINHYTSRIYYEISIKISEIINSYTSSKVKGYSFFYIYLDMFLSVFKSASKYIFKLDSPFFKFLYRVYKKTGRTRK